MARKPKVTTDPTISEDNVNTPAGASIVAKPLTKSGMMAQTLEAMMRMSPDQTANFMAQALALIGHEADPIDPSLADKNRMSVAMKGAMKEDVISIFGSEELSEEFKTKVETLFEAALEARLATEIQAIEEEADSIVEENVQESVNELIDKVDQYISFVAEKWLEENTVAIDSTLRTEITEEFIGNMKALFEKSNIEFPDSKIDIVEEFKAANETLEEKYNASLLNNIALIEQVNSFKKKEIFNTVTEGLAVSQIEKLKTLSESIDFDPETYATKLSIIKESFVAPTQASPSKNSNFLVEEENDFDEPAPVYSTPAMERYAKAISRTSIKK